MANLEQWKLQVQLEENGAWTDVKTPTGELLIFPSRTEARTELEKRFPVLVAMEKFHADTNRARVIAVIGWDDDDKNVKRK